MAVFSYAQGFRKVDPDRWEFANEHFLRGQKHLLKNIVRRRNHESGGGGLGGVGGRKGGTAGKELASEVERLMQERNAMAMDLARLKQSQKAMDQEVREMNKRLQATERRPQRTMGFLAKVVEDPTILVRISKEFKQQRGDRIAGKRQNMIAARRELETVLATTPPAAASPLLGGSRVEVVASGASGEETEWNVGFIKIWWDVLHCGK